MKYRCKVSKEFSFTSRFENQFWLIPYSLITSDVLYIILLDLERTVDWRSFTSLFRVGPFLQRCISLHDFRTMRATFARTYLAQTQNLFKTATEGRNVFRCLLLRRLPGKSHENISTINHSSVIFSSVVTWKSYLRYLIWLQLKSNVFCEKYIFGKRHLLPPWCQARRAELRFLGKKVEMMTENRVIVSKGKHLTGRIWVWTVSQLCGILKNCVQRALESASRRCSWSCSTHSLVSSLWFICMLPRS